MVLAQVLLLFVATMGVPVDDENQKQESVVADLPPFAGQALRFETPVNGQKVAAGDSLPVAIEFDDNLELEAVMVTISGGMIILEPPFRGQVPVARDMIGAMKLVAMAKTAAGGMVNSKTITVEVEVRDAELLTVEVYDENPWLIGPGYIYSISVYGEYSDGIRRDISDYHTIYSIVEGTDIACVTDDGHIIGRSPGTASVLVKHGSLDKVLDITVGDERGMNNIPRAVLNDQYEGVAGETFCFSGSVSSDFDACLGEPLGEESFQWTLTFDSETFEGAGTSFCVAPQEAGFGLLALVVTDRHGAVSRAYAMVIVS